MRVVRRSIAITFTLALAACAKTDPSKTDPSKSDTTATTGTQVDSTATATTTTTAPATETTPPAPPPSSGATPSSSWVVTAQGIGKLRAGMTVAEARAAIPGFSVPASRDSTACTYGKANSLPAGVFVMVEGGKVVRVEVRKGDVATSAGARIGDSEARIKTLYPNVTALPHKYTAGGHYLTVVPASAADSEYRIIFETDGKRVTTYRAGTRPQVDYVEGCG